MPEFLIANYKGDKATILRDPNYQKTLTYIREAFPASDNATGIVLRTWLDKSRGLVQITEECWSHILPGLLLIQVEFDRSHWGKITVHVKGKISHYEVDFATETREALKNKVLATEGLSSHTHHLWATKDSPPKPSFELNDNDELMYQGLDTGCVLILLDEAASFQLTNKLRSSCLSSANN